MIVERTTANKQVKIELTPTELSLAYKEYSIFKMKNEVLLWDLEFSENDAQLIAERAFDRLEKQNTKTRRECLDIEADRLRKEKETLKVGTMMYL